MRKLHAFLFVLRRISNVPSPPLIPIGLFTVFKDGAIRALDVNTGDVLIKKSDAHEYVDNIETSHCKANI